MHNPCMNRHIIARNTRTVRQPVISRTRDKVSNGRIASCDVDLRSTAGRRFSFLVQSYSAELGDVLTEPELALVKQVASLQLKIEQMQGLIIEGADVDADAVIRLSSEHRRLLATLKGKSDKAKPGPDDALQRYLATSNFQVPDDAADDAEHDALEPESTPIP
jgi:hypothetical protein